MSTEQETVEKGTPRPSESADLRERLTSSRALPRIVLAVGLGLGLASLVWYESNGYDRRMLLLWLGSLLVLAAFFLSRSWWLPRFDVRDLVAPLLATAAVAPLYLIALYEWPVQVDSDELAVSGVAAQYADVEGVDPFGVSTYLSRPTLLFLAWGDLGQWLGGIDLYHMRLLHALVGLLVVAASYALFRQLLPRNWAVFATLVFGTSHSFFMISRLAMRENTAVLVEVVALALLLWGLRNDYPLATFAGGFAAGLGFYVYFPARATFPVWVLFLGLLPLFYRRIVPLRKLAAAAGTATAGFVLMAGPIMIAESRLPADVVSPQRETLLLFPEGRKLQQQWEFAPTEWEGVRKNISYGLTTFNNNISDHGWIYDNEGHGFVDPLTGVLLWVGVVVVGLALIRRRAAPWALLSLAGFISLWLSFAFVVNKAPNYTRLLITLPFVAYLVTEAVRFLAERTKPWVARWRSARTRHAAPGFAVAMLAALVVWNVAIAWDFVDEGRRNGEAIGSTGRYVEEHEDTGQRFYLAADDSWKYYDWLQTDQRLRLFAKPEQIGGVVVPTALSSFSAAPPFALFLRRDLLMQNEQSLTDKYPRGRVRNIVPDGRLVVFEVKA